MAVFLDFVTSTVKAFFLFMTFDFVKITTKSRFHMGSTINFVHYVRKSTSVNQNSDGVNQIRDMNETV